jgi:hypothetical protein
MKIKVISKIKNKIIIDVLPEDEELVLEYLRYRELEIAATKLVKDELIPVIEGIRYADKRILAGSKYNHRLRFYPSPVLSGFSFNNFKWELVDED